LFYYLKKSFAPAGQDVKGANETVPEIRNTGEGCQENLAGKN